jgi:hypothetical protein
MEDQPYEDAAERCPYERRDSANDASNDREK